MGERILVIDDEPQILWLIGRFLRKLDYEVVETQRGQEALELLQRESFALILSDLRMPDVDGLTILEQVTERYPDTIFIIMTAHATIDLTILALRKGVYDFLTKPLDLNQLTLTVQKALRHRELTIQNRQLVQSLQANNIKLEAMHREEKYRSAQLRRVNEIAHQITALLDIDRLINTVIEQVSEAFGFIQMRFATVENGLLCFRGPLGKELGVPVKQSIYWTLTQEGQHPFVRTSADNGDTLSVNADLIFPLRAGDQVLGFWIANWHPDNDRREDKLPYLEALAAQTATVLENAQLYTLAKRADELAFINRVGEASKQSLNLKETIQSVLLCIQEWGAHLVEICLFDEENQVQQAFRLIQDTFFQDDHSVLGNDLIRRIGTSPLLLQDQEKIKQFGQTHEACHAGLSTLLGVPLFFGIHPIGVLIVGQQSPYAHTLEDGHLLQIAGRQVAMAIENARLFQEVESSRRAITESRNTLLAVFDSILDGIYIVDHRLKILAINRAQAERTHKSFGQLVGQPAATAFPGSVHTLECITKTFESRQPTSCVEQLLSDDADSDTRLTEWHIHTYPVATEKDQIEHVVVVVRDVTEQRRLEATLIQSEKMASVGQLAAGVAHEINNPLTVITTNVEILREEIPPDNPLFESVELIGRAAERASHTVQSLLRFSRPEQFQFAPTDVNESLNDTLALIGQQLRKANIQVEADLLPDLPPVFGSRSQLRAVWLNLLLNARDAIHEAQREGQIRISSQVRDHSVVVKITDNGIGMSPHVLKRLYDPFFTTKTPDKGTGLGLFNCYRAVEQHQGEIRVESQEGVGTTFEVRLPVEHLNI